MKRKTVCFAMSLLIFLLAGLSACGGKKDEECPPHDFRGRDCETRVCEKCGETMNPIVMHDYGAWQTILAATCKQEGRARRVCEVCGYAEEKTIPLSSAHDYRDGVCAVCGADESQEEGIEMGAAFFAFENAHGEIVRNACENEDGILFTASSAQAGVWYREKEFDEFSAGDKKHIVFKIKTEGKEPAGYSAVRLADAEGSIIDYGFPNGEWLTVGLDCEIEHTPRGNSVFFRLENAVGVPVCLSGFGFDDDVLELDGIFGGVKLYQMKPNGLMEGYVLVTVSGKTVVSDGGQTSDVAELQEILSLCGNKVDYWFLTHYHDDHIPALIEILSNDIYDSISIENLYYAFPSLEIRAKFPREDFSTVTSLEDALEGNPGRVNRIATPKKNDVIVIDESLTVKVLNDAWFGNESNLGNDSSVVYKVETAGENIVFLGDLAAHGDTLLRDQYFYDESRSCTVIQMAHHGQRGVSDDFYRRIDHIKICLYPGPQWLFDADTDGGINSETTLFTMHTRDLMRELGVRYSFGGNARYVLG